MASRDPIRVFVTHAWEESDDYLRVFEYLESARNFRYQNLSRPDRGQNLQGVEGPREELRKQIRGSEALIALASLYVGHRDLLVFQINYAKSEDIPVVLLGGFGREVALPKEIESLADEKCGWDERALIDAIKRQARHEESTRWDTIEFKLD